MEALKIASNALNSNIESTRSGPLFCCGPSHFHHFWVRDFSHAVPGLLLIGRADAVKNDLELTLSHIREDGVMPRCFDVIDPKIRVTLGVFGIDASRFWPYANHDLKPEYVNENLTLVSDSNILTLEACLHYLEFSADQEFLKAREEQMKKAFQGIFRMQKGMFLEQPKFSDWQDSANRAGAVFLLNILFFRLVDKLQKKGFEWAKGVNLEVWRKNLWEHFYSPQHGLFLDNLADKNKPNPRFSLESLLWAIEGNFFEKYIPREKLWEALKASPLWQPYPGIPVHPQYAWSEVSWTCKFVGLRHYHDGVMWSWLMGESLRIATLMKDKAEANRIAALIERTLVKYQTVHEVYDWKGEPVPVRRHFYRSEYNFSWGSAKIVEGIAAYKASVLGQGKG